VNDVIFIEKVSTRSIGDGPVRKDNPIKTFCGQATDVY
jgi:hypothetical protein